MSRLAHSMFGLLVSATLLAATPLPAAAWGVDGHEAVGDIADRLLAGTATGKQVKTILGGTLKNAAIWADCARSVKRVNKVWVYDKDDKFRAKDCDQFSDDVNNKALIAFVSRNASHCDSRASYQQCRHKAYHFTDIPIQRKHYGTSLPGADEHDLVHAIAATLVVLRDKKAKSPAPFDITSQREAMRLLAHYIGDLHQPLHVGSIYLNDDGTPLDPANAHEAAAHANAGGNSLVSTKGNLHHLWDTIPGTLKLALFSLEASNAAKAQAATAGPSDGWVQAWADESINLAPLAFKALKIDPKRDVAGGTKEWPVTTTEPDYQKAREALQREQIIKAGARLAALLKVVMH